jgi:hypothetical protein
VRESNAHLSVTSSMMSSTGVTLHMPHGCEPHNCTVDNTLRVEKPKSNGGGTDYEAPADEAGDVFRACDAAPCYLATASANHNWRKIQSVLRDLYGTTVGGSPFTDAFFDSPAFQVWFCCTWKYL